MNSALQNDTGTRASGRWLGLALLVALVVMAILRSFLGTRLDSFTVDEPYHVVAGTSYVRTGDFRLNPEHPPLMKLWLGASMPDTFKLRPFQPLNEKVEERDFAEETVFYDNNATALQVRMRQSLWFFHGLLLLALGLLLWRAAGLAWAVGALAYVAIEPTLMAHMPVAMTDLPLSLTLALASVAAAIAVTTWHWRWITVFGLTMGLALASKHSALPGLLGLALVSCVAATISGRPVNFKTIILRGAKLLVAGLTAWILLWALYGGRFHAAADGTDPFNREISQKINDLHDGAAKQLISTADKWHLLPRAYLWGLADTIRTGVEGRGLRHFFFGKWYEGSVPILYWPAAIVTKIPVGLVMLCFVGVLALWRAPLTQTMRWVLFCGVGMATAHLVTLGFSKGTWGGVRHALPVLLVLSFLAGAVLWRAWNARSRALGLVWIGCWLVALGMTIREPRLWEYSNELAGGTAGNYRYFRNEGQDLGQRYAEFKTFYDKVIQPSGQPFYSTYWFIEEQAKTDGIRYSRFCTVLNDQNTEAVFNGYYLVKMSDFVPVPHDHWDPATFDGLERVVRLGNIAVLKGRWVTPQIRAFSLRERAIEEIYKNKTPDWSLLATKLAEVSAALPWSSATAVLLGNACLKVDRRQEAIAAYQHALREMDKSDDAKQEIERQIERLQSGQDLASIQPLRSQLLE